MPNIAVVVSEWSPQCPNVLAGIIDFANSTADWNIQYFHSSGSNLEQAITGWGTEGILFCADRSPEYILTSPASWSVPLVSLGTPSTSFPSVIADPASMLSLAFEHLEQNRFDKIALITRAPGPAAAQGSHSELIETAHKLLGDRFEHVPLTVTSEELISTRPASNGSLGVWLTAAKAIGVLVPCDQLAAYLVRVARGIGKQIPNELSVVALRDSYLCTLPMTSITAVEEPLREQGLQAARLLHRLLAGHPAPTQPLRVAAEKVNSRLTTIAPTLTQAISRALRFIQENATRGISVSDVMAFQQTSRVTFERNFREAIGCPPGEQIRKVRMAHAENLLRTTNLSVAEVGKQCGFDTIAKFSTFFKNAAGISPLKFRHQHRLDNTHNPNTHNPLHLNGEPIKDAQESE